VCAFGGLGIGCLGTDSGHRFRHLPVLDKDGAVVGLLDIAKCLYDAITVLEKVQDKGESGVAMAEMMAAAMK